MQSTVDAVMTKVSKLFCGTSASITVITLCTTELGCCVATSGGSILRNGIPQPEATEHNHIVLDSSQVCLVCVQVEETRPQTLIKE